MANYEDILIDSIELIAKNAVDNARYDQTIQASVVRCLDEEAGAYIVKYQDAKFEAYAANLSEVYTSKDQVYVLIPGNNMSAHKTILSKVKNISQIYSTVVEEDNNYIEITSNIINFNKEIGICSYASQPIISDMISSVYFLNSEIVPNSYLENAKGIVLFDENDYHINGWEAERVIDSERGWDYIKIHEPQSSANIMTIDLNALKTFLEYNSTDKYIKMGGTFRTDLSEEQQYVEGNYGLYIEIQTTYGNRVGYILDVSSMTFIFPYNLVEPATQVVYKDLKIEQDDVLFNYNISMITKIVFFQQNFLSDDTHTLNDIFLSKIIFQGVERLFYDENGFAFRLVAKDGKYAFTKDDDEQSTIILNAQLWKDGEQIPAHELTYYWFKQGIPNEEEKSVNDKMLKYL